MRVAHPSVGEFFEGFKSRTNVAAAPCLTPPVLVLPEFSESVAGQYEQVGDAAAWGYIGQWLIELNLLQTEDWKEESPIQAIQDALLKAVATRAGKASDYLTLEVSIRADQLAVPECATETDAEAWDAPVLLGLSTNDDDIWNVPKLRDIADINKDAAKAINGLLSCALDKTIGCFNPSKAWDTAIYHHWWGEVHGSEDKLVEDDKSVQEIIDSGEMHGETPLPSEVAKAIPFCLHSYGAKKGDLKKSKLQGYDDVAAAFESLMDAYRAFERSQKNNIQAFGFNGQYNYVPMNAVAFSHLSEWERHNDEILDMFDAYRDQNMNSGEGTPLMGLCGISNKKEFKQWLENFSLGCKVVTKAIELLETLK
jgi:hypothetical protein